MNILEVGKLNVQIANNILLNNVSFDVKQGEVILLSGPNGCGKSTIIKVIVGDVFGFHGLKYNSDIIRFYDENGSIISINKEEKNKEVFRKKIVYISQIDEFESNSLYDCLLSSLDYYQIENKMQYIFDFLKKYNIYSCFEGYKYWNNKHKIKHVLKQCGINEKNASDEDWNAAKIFLIDIRKLSGGQKKMANIVSNLIRYEFCRLILIDEPLNNLDYGNIRRFSNILTQIYKSKPELGIIVVSHCRSIPIINKVFEVNPEKKTIELGTGYSCSSCFGVIDDEGRYI